MNEKMQVGSIISYPLESGLRFKAVEVSEEIAKRLAIKPIVNKEAQVIERLERREKVVLVYQHDHLFYILEMETD